jgi:hypothetical protein
MNNRLIKSNDAGGGGCTNTVDLYNPFPDGGGVALYQLNGDATDVSGNYDGTATNVTYGAGQFGQAAVFNGSSSYISNNSLGNLLFRGAFSVSVWFKTSSLPSTQGTIFMLQDINNDNTPFFSLNISSTGNLRYIARTNTSSLLSSSTDVLSLNTWYNAVLQITSTGAEFYLNGSFQDSETFTPSFVTDFDGNVYLGVRGIDWASIKQYYYNGSIDQVRIFSRALRPYEVEALYTEEYCTPTIVPSEHFNTVLYDGNSSTQDINVGFAPDLVWAKSRDTGTQWHGLYDTIRGVGESLYSNATNAEEYRNNSLTAFNSDGFSVGDWASINLSGDRYVSWNFKAGGAAVENTDGTITSQVSANTEAGFSIVSYTGNFVAGATIGHGLGVEPNMIIVKERSQGTGGWLVYHSALGTAANVLYLNGTSSVQTGVNTFNGTNPTNSVFSLGANGEVNDNGQTNIAYCFAEVEGFSSFGSYVGTGTAGNTVVTGFEPAFVMIKNASGAGNWLMFDNKRSPSNPLELNLDANNSEAEENNINYRPSFLENGFSIAGTSGGINTNGSSYIYMAFAADPTTVEPTLEDSFNTVLYTGNGGTQSVTNVGFQPDMLWIKNRTTAASHLIQDSVRGAGQNFNLYPDFTGYEGEYGSYGFVSSFDNNGFSVDASTNAYHTNSLGDNYVSWNWKGAELPAINSNGSIPSVVSANPASGFSIVSYTGNYTNSTVGHGLGVAPNVIIVKSRSSGTANWCVYHSSIGATGGVFLNLSNAAQYQSNLWLDTEPTSEVFSIGQSDVNVNNSPTIAYCFAEVAGFSKFGSYTGNGGNQTITTDFEPKFVIIKCSSAGESYRNWFMLYKDGSSMKSVVANGSGAEFDQTGTITFNSDNFNINCGGCGEYNQSGQTYIYMAFANQF